jgi:cyclopropane fatty-acyl-phospholipid synthase-like methyltransferase
MHSFLEKYDAAMKPMAALRNFGRGRATPEQVEAIRFVTPEIFKSLQVKTLDQLTKGKELPFAARQRMADMLGITTDPSQTQEMAALLRKSSAMGMGTPQGAAGAKSGGGGRGHGRAAKMPASLDISKFDLIGARRRR